jgi:hypothetical protein
VNKPSSHIRHQLRGITDNGEKHIFLFAIFLVFFMGFWWENLKKKGHLKEMGLDTIILKCILKTQDRRTGLD